MPRSRLAQLADFNASGAVEAEDRADNPYPTRGAAAPSTALVLFSAGGSAPSGPSGQAAVGHRVKMLWRAECPPSRFTGVVKEFNTASGEHLVVYDDGDQRWHGMEGEAREGNVEWLDPPPSKPTSGKRARDASPKPSPAKAAKRAARQPKSSAAPAPALPAPPAPKEPKASKPKAPKEPKEPKPPKPPKAPKASKEPKPTKPQAADESAAAPAASAAAEAQPASSETTEIVQPELVAALLMPCGGSGAAHSAALTGLIKSAMPAEDDEPEAMDDDDDAELLADAVEQEAQIEHARNGMLGALASSLRQLGLAAPHGVLQLLWRRTLTPEHHVAALAALRGASTTWWGKSHAHAAAPVANPRALLLQLLRRMAPVAPDTTDDAAEAEADAACAVLRCVTSAARAAVANGGGGGPALEPWASLALDRELTSAAALALSTPRGAAAAELLLDTLARAGGSPDALDCLCGALSAAFGAQQRKGKTKLDAQRRFLAALGCRANVAQWLRRELRTHLSPAEEAAAAAAGAAAASDPPDADEVCRLLRASYTLATPARGRPGDALDRPAVLLLQAQLAQWALSRGGQWRAEQADAIADACRRLRQPAEKHCGAGVAAGLALAEQSLPLLCSLQPGDGSSSTSAPVSSPPSPPPAAAPVPAPAAVPSAATTQSRFFAPVVADAPAAAPAERVGGTMDMDAAIAAKLATAVGIPGVPTAAAQRELLEKKAASSSSAASKSPKRQLQQRDANLPTDPAVGKPAREMTPAPPPSAAPGAGASVPPSQPPPPLSVETVADAVCAVLRSHQQAGQVITPKQLRAVLEQKLGRELAGWGDEIRRAHMSFLETEA